MATYNVKMKQYNGTSFDDVLPLAYDSQLLDGKSYNFIYDKIFNDSQVYPRSLLYIGIGKYTGTGTYGIANEITITFPEGCVMFMFPDTNIEASANRIVFLDNLPISYGHNANINLPYSASDASLFVKRDVNNNSISWYGTDSAARQMNSSNDTYYYAYVCSKEFDFIVLTESTTFTVPKTGYYNIELHGKGGDAKSDSFGNTKVFATGGGSGQLYSNVLLQKDDVYTVTIGDSASFGSYTVAKGGDGSISSNREYSGGAASGNLASKGTAMASSSSTTLVINGGSGGSSIGNYGDGGEVGFSPTVDPTGRSGAVIITYVGESI